MKVLTILKKSVRGHRCSLGVDRIGGESQAHHVEGWCRDTGKSEDILEENCLILDGIESLNEGRVEDGASMVGHVRIGKRAVTMSRSIVRSHSMVGEDCKIGPNAYVGPYTAVEDRCQIFAAEADDSVVTEG
jgi:NDP-sugar pyrophosphorylase family protein